MTNHSRLNPGQLGHSHGWSLHFKGLLAAIPLLVASASATPCSSSQYDMLHWFAMSSSWAQSYHLTGNANPLYTYRSGDTLYWIKGASGHPWDVNPYDNNYIYQWATEYKWTDPTSYKAVHGRGASMSVTNIELALAKPARVLLRHTLATLAYHGGKTLGAAPLSRASSERS